MSDPTSLRVVLHFSPRSDHHRTYAEAMRLGLTRHGITALHGQPNRPEACDVAVCWGARQTTLLAAGRPVLILERGHVGDRYKYASCGWDSLGRRGRYPEATDGGARWRERYGHLLQPWRPQAGPALIIGQVPGDAALRGLDTIAWATEAAARLRAAGWEVRFRPHPLAEHRGPVGVPLADGDLAKALSAAALCVTYNSTTGVEAVLAGVPTVTLDAGAMAWPMAAHSLDETPNTPRFTPDREAWAHDLAWTQWTMDEIASGAMWAALAPLRVA